MALLAGLSVARERELGTLETLFYGPVSHLDYLLGKHLAYLMAYMVMLAAFLVACVVVAFLTHLVLSPLLLAIAGLSVATAMGLIGSGLLVAAVMRTVRGTFLLFVGLMVVVLALEVGQVILTSIVSSRSFAGLIVLRDTMAVLDRIVTWLSPASYLLTGADAAMRQNWPEWIGYVARAVLYGVVTLSLSTELLRRKGVIR
jgi:ABC-type transport system involved in multi-copper enzyme maturation permease subunit